ncbi:MAG TPA: two-component regulator propeller domain-containing protein, partial [Fimbriiglobus sp.]|nr:two-component regulator propeller domain-containing protein [Fimbriiglobus sp.]
MRLRHAVIPLVLTAVFSACAAGQDDGPRAGKKTTGETVAGLDQAIFYIFQGKDNTYWFGSNERGVYRYDGKSLINFTTKDGLAGDRIRGIQEDMSGNVYVTTYEGISRFDGKAFTTLGVSPRSDWKKEPGDLWFVGPPDTGVVYRYDGTALHRLPLPKSKVGEEAAARFPRSKYPNAIFSPYDVYTIATDRGGNVWFGTAAAGACRFDGRSFSWLFERHLTETPAGGSFGIRSILEDKDGAFWLCNTRHRYVIDPKGVPDAESGLMKYRREPGVGRLKAPNGDDHMYFMSAVDDAKGVLWMASGGFGVWRYDGDTVTRYPVRDGAKEVTLFSVYKDNRGD